MKYLKLINLIAATTLLVGCATNKNSSNNSDDEPSSSNPPAPKEPIENDSGLPEITTYLDEPGIMIHYQRYQGSYLPWGLWLWSENAAGNEYEFNYSDDYGIVAYYPTSLFVSPTVGFIVKQLFSYAGDNVWVKDYDADRFLDTDLLQLDEHNCYNIYIADNSGSKIYTDKEKTKLIDGISTCQFENSSTILVQGNNPLKEVTLYNGETVVSESNYTLEKSLKNKKYVFTLNNPAKVDDLYRAHVVFESDVSCYKAISIRKLYDATFENTYRYDGELGAIYTMSSTTFKVWSPVSQRIDLNLYDNGTPTSVSAELGSDVKTTHAMTKDAKGVFSVTIDGDLHGKYYTYTVYNASFQGKEIVDPYAKSAGVNGLRGMVVDFSEVNPVGWDSVNYLTYDRKELTVYETHIAELTCSDTWGGTPANAKKYKGFYETGTTYSENGTTVTTGFDHIKELGVNAVQIIPFFDQANDEINTSFNWGYNPLNYNVVEGSYSSNPYDGYVRINELKNLIKAYNEAGIEIIMDVVYNHVNGLSGSNFDVLMPFYYFRYTEDGQPGNGSGCGNETASDKYMFRKFMVDSVCFWTKEYKLGGFRFDLMGLHDIETMNLIVQEAKKINPNIVIYGEPWAGGTSHLPSGCESAVQANAKDYVGFGQFNDLMRDAMIKSGMNLPENRGWIVQTEYTIPNVDILAGLQGKTGAPSVWCATEDPDKTVNYATCHDNYTLHDRILVAGVEPNDELYEKMNVLANSIVFTSQGTTFMLAGEEMLRTKVVYDVNGNPKEAVDKDGNPLGYYEVTGNSYSSSYKTNEINYSWKVNHPRMMENYKKLIALKQAAEGLHGTTANEVESLNGRAIVKTTFTYGGHEYIAYHGNGVNDGTFTVDTTGYSLYWDTLGMPFVEGNMAIHPFETLIIYK